MLHNDARAWRRTLQGSQEQPGSATTPPTEPYGGRNPRTIRIIVAVVAIIVVIAGIVTYIYVTQQQTQCVLTSKNPLLFDQAEPGDTLDPQVTFSTPGWAAVQQVYQTLVMYNASSYTTYVGVLAKSWTESSDGMNITFHLRSGVHFSNGDPFNAYVMWYSLYRTLVMNAPPSFILSQNFGFPHTDASSATDAINASTANVTNDLNSFGFSNPTSSEIAVMSDPDQSFQVIDNATIQLNLGRGYLGEYPYTYIFATLASPVASAVDPIVIGQNGGVSEATNDWMSANALGTGPYLMTNYNKDTGYTLTPDPNYWGTSAAASEPWNNILQPAKSTIQIGVQSDVALTSSDLKTGRAVGASFDYLGPSTVSDLQSSPCVTVKPLAPVYGSTAGGWWIYMNQNQAPFSNLSVRAAVVHAINYDRMIQQAFGGHAVRWVGPVPPGYPYYNPNNLTPYVYNLTLAKQYMSNSPWPNGYPATLNYMYLNTPDWEAVATFLQEDLAQIGINIKPVPITLNNLYEEQARDQNGVCTSETTANGGPFYIGQEFYTSDYIAPDDWTQHNAYSAGSANDCMSQYYNDTMDGLDFTAAATSDPTQLTQMYSEMTQMMYDNYTLAWLVVPTSFAVYSPFLQGVVSNPMGSGLPYVMTYNTEYAT